MPDTWESLQFSNHYRLGVTAGQTFQGVVSSNTPCDYRLGIRDGKILLQGCFMSWIDGKATTYEWRDLPTVELI